ncbi:MAG: hypothetical protein IMZ71_05755, partial [Chloroflexi bacterium]|nr:hypothetical protein [Chloroflexota bacterium]
PRAPSRNRDYDAGTGTIARTETTTKHIPPCDDILILKEKVAAIEAWPRAPSGNRDYRKNRDYRAPAPRPT